MINRAKYFFLLLVLLISAAVIGAAQSWGDGDWGGSDVNGGWGGNNVNDGWGGGQVNDVWGDSQINGGSVAGNDASWGSPTSAEISSSDEAIFPSSNSEISSTLIDETSSTQYNRASVAYMGWGGSSQNIFWIVSRDGSQHWRSVSIPCHRYARLLLIPSASGQLTMQERYPDGHVQTYNYGYVRAYNQYRFWFFADTSGIHQLRYRIDNGPYSDVLTFHVGSCGGTVGRICPCCGRPL
jgi:hypothetical protein